MKKNVIALLLSVALSLGSIGTIPSMAAEAVMNEVPAQEECTETKEADTGTQEAGNEQEENCQETKAVVTEQSESAQTASVQATESAAEAETTQETAEKSEPMESALEADGTKNIEEEESEEAVTSDVEEATKESTSENAAVMEEEDPADPLKEETVTVKGAEETVSQNAAMEGTEEIVDSGKCGENATWTLTGPDDNRTLTISGSGDMYYYSPYRPMSPGWWPSSFKKVVIEEGITNIANCAFCNDTNIESVTIPDSVTSIGDYAFRCCENLQSITIPDGVTSIGKYAFRSCENLQSITIPDNVTTIGAGAFWGCRNLTNVFLSDGLETIGTYAFVFCSFDHISIPDSVTEIGCGAFQDSENLKSVSLPKSLKSILPYCFSGCTNLTSINIPDDVEGIGFTAFANCSSLTSVSIPKKVSMIEEGAFYNCSSLTHVTIPDNSVEWIDDGAFENCSSLTSITIPESVSMFGSNIFNNTPLELIRGFKGSHAETFAKDNNIPFEAIDSYNVENTYVYSDADWAVYMSELNGALQYFCNKKNFMHVQYISENDNSVFGNFEYVFTNYIKLKDGWKELLTGETSVEDAEKILYAVMLEHEDKFKQLSDAKTGKKYAELFQKGLNFYLESEAYDVYTINQLNNFMNTNAFRESIANDGYDDCVNFILDHVDSSSRDKLENSLKDFKTSSALKKGLETLDTGLEIIDLVNGSVDEYVKVAKVKECNQLYIDLLQYIADNALNEVVKKAAGNLVKKQQESVESALLEYAIEAAADKVTDKLIELACKNCWILNGVKYGFDAGNALSNVVFHTQDTASQKSVMRMCAYIGEAMCGWVISGCDDSTSSKDDYCKAERAIAGLEVLANVRLHGEEALRKMSSYLWDPRSEQNAACAVRIVQIHQTGITSLKNYHLELLKVACPVDVEILDENKQVIFTIRDGEETEGTIGEVFYSSEYSPITKDYVKIVLLPENGGYSYRIRGNDVGRVSYEIGRVSDEGALVYANKTAVCVDENTVIDVNPAQAIEETSFTVTENNEVVESGTLVKKADGAVAVTGISTEEENITLSVGEKYSCRYTISPENADNQNVTWNSADEDTVTVDSQGVVTALKEGSATVSVTTDDGDKSVDYHITVQKAVAAQIVNASVDFKGTLGLNYYIDIPDEYLADENAYIEYTVCKAEPETVRHKISDLGIVTRQDRVFRKVTVNTVVKSVNDRIILHIYDGEGTKLKLLSAGGNDITEDGFTYSVAGYCNDIKEQSSNEDMKELAEALIQYGYRVQKYLGYRADEVGTLSDVSSVTAEKLEDFNGHRTKDLDGLTFNAFSFLFKEDSAIRYRFKITEGHSIDEYRFSVEGKEVTPEPVDDYYVIEVGNIRARDLGREYEVVVTGPDESSQTLCYSGISYAKALIEQGRTEEGKDAARALYVYYQAAARYFGDTTTGN